MRFSLTLLLICALCATVLGEQIICQDYFDSESNNQPPTFWTTTPYCKVTTATSWSGTKSVNTRDSGSMTRSCSTYGWTHVGLGYFYKVSGLENSDVCIAEYSIDSGANWITVDFYNSSYNNNAWQNGFINLPSTDVNAPNFVVRFRSNSDSRNNGNRCYWDSWTVSVF